MIAGAGHLMQQTHAGEVAGFVQRLGAVKAA
jgi:hypothetical protein